MGIESFIAEHLGELIVGSGIMLFGWAFREWAKSLRGTTMTILDKLEYLTKEFHQHRIDVERRVTRVETKVDLLHRDVEAEHESRH